MLVSRWWFDLSSKQGICSRCWSCIFECHMSCTPRGIRSGTELTKKRLIYHMCEKYQVHDYLIDIDPVLACSSRPQTVCFFPREFSPVKSADRSVLEYCVTQIGSTFFSETGTARTETGTVPVCNFRFSFCFVNSIAQPASVLFIQLEKCRHIF